MHGVLHFVLKEYICTKDSLCDQYDLEAHLKTCTDSFEAGLMTVEVLTMPSFENLLALAMGVSWESRKEGLGFEIISAHTL